MEGVLVAVLVQEVVLNVVLLVHEHVEHGGRALAELAGTARLNYGEEGGEGNSF
jgi:hypothetical protein